MGFWNAAQRRLWTGPVVRDFGEISHRQVRGASRTLSAILSDRDGRRVYLRESYRRFPAFSISFIELDRDEAARLRDILGEALADM